MEAISASTLNEWREILLASEACPASYIERYWNSQIIGRALLVKWWKYDPEAAWWYEKIGTYLANAIKRREKEDLEYFERAINWLLLAYLIYAKNGKEMEASATASTLAEFLENVLEIGIGERLHAIMELKRHKTPWWDIEYRLPIRLTKIYLSRILTSCIVLWLSSLNIERASGILNFAQKYGENFLNEHFNFSKELVKAFNFRDWRVFRKVSSLYSNSLFIEPYITVFSDFFIYEYDLEIHRDLDWPDIRKHFPYYDDYLGIWKMILDRVRKNFENVVKQRTLGPQPIPLWKRCIVILLFVTSSGIISYVGSGFLIQDARTNSFIAIFAGLIGGLLGNIIVNKFWR
jgi:membrane protein DedA with SNARE-associated domain